MVYDLHLVQVETPEESKYAWDYYKVLERVPGDQAFRSLADTPCPLLKK